MEKVCH